MSNLEHRDKAHVAKIEEQHARATGLESHAFSNVPQGEINSLRATVKRQEKTLAEQQTALDKAKDKTILPGTQLGTLILATRIPQGSLRIPSFGDARKWWDDALFNKLSLSHERPQVLRSSAVAPTYLYVCVAFQKIRRHLLRGACQKDWSILGVYMVGSILLELPIS